MEAIVLISPAEPAPLKSLGTVSSVPERYGVDFLIYSPLLGAIGIQRKELNDLVASVHDGRLTDFINKAKPLGLAVLLVEGKAQWTTDDLMMGVRSKWTRPQHLGLLWSIRSRGFWIDSTTSMQDSIAWLSSFAKWTSKDRHNTLSTRPGPSRNSVWGKADSRDWAVHLLQGFVGIGPETAGNIYDHFEGVPLQWTVTEEELRRVKGVGPGRAKQLLEALPPGYMMEEYQTLG